MNPRILIVDDETAIRSSLAEALAADDYRIETAETGEEALAKLNSAEFELVITDLKMPGVTGLELMEAMRNQDKQTPVIMMTAYGAVDSAVEAMRLGAYDFIQKPFKLGVMRKQVKAAIRATTSARISDNEYDARTIASSRSTLSIPDVGQGRYMEMVKSCPGLAKIAELLEKVGTSPAGNETSILIQGESGSGKEIIARAIHEVGVTAQEPFMEINCAAVPETLLESELMGHEKGAFTDAKSRKEGLFELAGTGTIFLDEIGEMGILLQSRLLRVLENRTFRRVGGKDELCVKARIVAATNRNLDQAIEDGAFRNDLYYRLQVVEIEIPPLRERPEDLGVLMDAFIMDMNLKLGLKTAPVSTELADTLKRYPWPGNVRELKNVLKRIMILESPAVLKASHFPVHIADGNDPRRNPSAHIGPAGLLPLSDVEKQQILFTLQKTDNNKSKAARILGISRQTLREKLRQYNVAMEDQAEA